jgi:enamine deaminase RidA (YjgF/YER057c/UK114 family)
VSTSSSIFPVVDVAQVGEKLARPPEAVWGDGVPKPKMAYSPAIRVGDWLFVAGQLASDFASGLAPSVVPSNPYIVSPLTEQARFVMTNIGATVAPTGATIMSNTVRISRWFTSATESVGGGAAWSACGVDDVTAAEAEIIGAGQSATSTLGIGALMVSGTQLEIDVIARLDDSSSEPVYSPEEVPIGIRRGEWVFLDAHSSPPRDGFCGIAAQTEAILADLETFAASTRSSLAHAVKAEVYLRDPRDQPSLERVWSERFGRAGPAKVVVTSVAPRHPLAAVEIALTLLTDAADTTPVVVHSADAPEPLGGGPQAVRAGELLFFSTQMAFDSSGGLAPGMQRNAAFPWYGSPGRAQMRYMLDNVDAICEAAGTSVDNLVRRVCYHDDLQWFGESIDEWAARLPGLKPASTTLQVAGPLGVPGANTMLDLIAYVPEPAQ